MTSSPDGVKGGGRAAFDALQNRSLEALHDYRCNHSDYGRF